MGRNKIFILGVGCQKGGTTWLHSQLQKYDNVNLGFCKEYHFFDQFYLKGIINRKERWLKSLRKNINKNPLELPDKDILRHLLFAQDEDAYYQYFDNLWSSDEKISIVGDITPSYSALEAEHFSRIRKKLEDRGFTVKVIFFMRDPVERIWSAIRMKKRKRLEGGILIKESDNNLLLSSYKSYKVSGRTRYDLTILNLEQVFDQDNILYCLFEDLFTTESTSKLQGFLGFNDNRFDANVRENVSPKKHSVDIATKKEVATYYREVYNFVIKRFPIENRWSNYKLLND